MKSQGAFRLTSELHLDFSLLRASIPLQRKLDEEVVEPRKKIKRPDGHRDIETMNYMKDVDAWLEDSLRVVRAVSQDEDAEAIIADVKREIKEKILESYRNGQNSRRGVLKGFAREAWNQVRPASKGQPSKPRPKSQYSYGKQN